MQYARQKNELTTYRFFINPNQFNRQEDLWKYSHNIYEKVSLLEEVRCYLYENIA
ncbi:MAG: pantoate--beta-alanine ligase [Flavobacteriales bacterium Tduv]